MKAVEESVGYYQQGRPEMLGFLPQEYQNVLEIGCAEGCFSTKLNPESEVWGIEINPHAAEVAKKRMHTVLVGKYDEVADQLPRNYFDLVICNDVIEHMPDCDEFLNKIQEKMKRGGNLMGSIPNVRYFKNLFSLLFLKDWKYVEAGILDRTHLRFFTKKSLHRSLQNNAYRIVKFKGINGCSIIPRTVKSFFKLIVLTLVFLLSLGMWFDIQFLQFGFLAQLDQE